MIKRRQVNLDRHGHPKAMHLTVTLDAVVAPRYGGDLELLSQKLVELWREEVNKLTKKSDAGRVVALYQMREEDRGAPDAKREIDERLRDGLG